MPRFRITKDELNRVYMCEEEVYTRCGFLWLDKKLVWRLISFKGDYMGYGFTKYAVFVSKGGAEEFLETYREAQKNKGVKVVSFYDD